MAQSKDNKVLKQLWKDLEDALHFFCWELHLSIGDAVIYERLTDMQLLDAMRIHHFAMDKQCGLAKERSLRVGMDYWNDANPKFGCDGIDRQIKALMNLEQETGWQGVPETRFEDLKTAVISMQEYDGTWEALYTTEERPF